MNVTVVKNYWNIISDYLAKTKIVFLCLLKWKKKLVQIERVEFWIGNRALKPNAAHTQ